MFQNLCAFGACGCGGGVGLAANESWCQVGFLRDRVTLSKRFPFPL